MVGDLLAALGIYKGGCLKEVEMRDCLAASVMASVDEHICERGHFFYEKGLSKLSLYKYLARR